MGHARVLADRIAQVSDVYAARTGVTRDDDWYALKLMEEAGEQARDDEAADLFAMVVLYCRHNGIDIEAALERKWFMHLKATA